MHLNNLLNKLSPREKYRSAGFGILIIKDYFYYKRKALHTVRFLKYVRPFYNIMHERVKSSKLMKNCGYD